MGRDAKLTLSRWEVAAAAGVVASFGMGLVAVCLSMPASDYSFLKLPRTLEDIQDLRDNLESYTTDYTIQVAQRREKLLNYMLFLRVTPTLPNTFINVASPIVDVPYRIFFMATFIGLIPAAYVTVRAGIALGELRSVADLYDFQAIATLFLIGIVSVTPTLISKNHTVEIA
ncbi:hypothetical protein C4D60_Mb04t34500 [Musa balbisiana]|uniref:VTT domain-containing protein n=1 Tax=Musa balbisiana TaxID=52838 RepID=A0A4V4HA86_MUSBA|nr:hypothetical protein C4D60_Mb04t34500 [Musa balbisiana]